jgi:hypothetical protein
MTQSDFAFFAAGLFIGYVLAWVLAARMVARGQRRARAARRQADAVDPRRFRK